MVESVFQLNQDTLSREGERLNGVAESMHLPFPVFVVDDNRSARVIVRRMLESFGVHGVHECENGRELLAALTEHGPGIIFLDLVMPGKSGVELLTEVIDTYPQVTIIVVSGMGELQIAVDCMKRGAYDYLEKPASKDDLLASLKRAVEVHEAKHESYRIRQHYLDDELEQPEVFAPIVTRDPQIRRLCQYCEAVAPSRQPVLVTGETGVGKELFARVIHDLSGRSGEFVAVDVAAMDATLASDAFFGHVRGA
jgi:DNA-binding NtrC family response regulator